MKQRITGVLKRSIFGGDWTLEGPDDELFSIVGEIPDSLVEGDRVRIDGYVDDNLMSFDMSGPVLRLQSIKKL